MTWSIFGQSVTDNHQHVSAATGAQQAEGWAYALLRELGVANPTQAQTQFVYDWELAEGGGGTYNPLNAGPDPLHKTWSGGSQYGGGAASYDTLQHGLLASVDYLNMPNYRSVKQDIVSGDIAGARAALIASPWAASHYGGKLPTSSLPVPISSGGIGSATLPQGNVPGLWNNITAATGRVFGDIGSGVGKVGGGVGKGLVSGIASGLGVSPAVIIVGVIILIVILLKKR